MDRDFVEEWHRNARRVWLSICGEGLGDQVRFGKEWAKLQTRFRLAPDSVPGRWRTPDDDAFLAAYCMELAAQGAKSRKVGGPIPVKAIRLGLALARGNLGAIPAPDAHGLAALGLFVPLEDQPKAPTPPPAGPSFTVEFGYGFKAGSKTGRATGETRVERLDAERAPVAWILRSRMGDFAVRLVDDVPYRPIAAPDGTHWLDEAEFVQAAKGGSAWRDSPFVRAERDVPALGLDEMSVPIAPSDDRELNRKLAEAGRFVSVDGTVYRRTEHPQFTATIRGQWTVGVAWSLPGIDQDEPMGTLNPRGGWRRADVAKRFRAMDVGDAHAAARAFASLTGRSFDQNPAGTREAARERDFDAEIEAIREFLSEGWRTTEDVRGRQAFRDALGASLADLDSAPEILRRVARACRKAEGDAIPDVAAMVESFALTFEERRTLDAEMDVLTRMTP